MRFLINLLYPVFGKLSINLCRRYIGMPEHSCIDLRSAPFSRRCAAKECLKVWGVMSLLIFAWFLYCFIIFQNPCLVSLFPFTLTNRAFSSGLCIKSFETSSNIPATHLRILNQSEQFFLAPCCTLYIAFQGLHHPNQGNELRHSYSCCVKKLKHCLVPVSF